MFVRNEEKMHPVKKIVGKVTLRLPKKKLLKKGEIQLNDVEYDIRIPLKD